MSRFFFNFLNLSDMGNVIVESLVRLLEYINIPVLLDNCIFDNWDFLDDRIFDGVHVVIVRAIITAFAGQGVFDQVEIIYLFDGDSDGLVRFILDEIDDDLLNKWKFNENKKVNKNIFVR